jgi:tight adherence protein C
MNLMGYEFGFDLPSMIVLLSFLAAFLSVLAVGLPLVVRSTFSDRLKAVTERREELKGKQSEQFQQRKRLLPSRQEGIMRAVIKALKMEDLLTAKVLRQRLIQAGWRSASTPVRFIFGQIALPVLFLVVGYIYVTIVLHDKPLPMRLVLAVVAAAFGYFMPRLLLTNAITKRQAALRRSFPDGLDLMVICVESGMSVEAAFQKVSDEMAESAPELAEEMGLTAAELAFLSDRRQAFENLAERTGLPTFKSLATTLLQSEKYGTPIAQGLRVIAQENRDMRLNAAEKKAAALPAKLTVPMILFFLPVIFIVIIGPVAITLSKKFG